MPGAVATFDYMFFFRIAPVAQKPPVERFRTGVQAGADARLLTNVLVRERTIRPQLIRIFCKLILRTGGTLGNMHSVRRILIRTRSNLK